MDEDESLSHSRWECKDHVVLIPKGRRKVLNGQLRRHLPALRPLQVDRDWVAVEDDLSCLCRPSDLDLQRYLTKHASSTGQS